MSRRRSSPKPPPTPPEPEAPLPDVWWGKNRRINAPATYVDSVAVVLDDLKKGSYRIPPFQRKFVWSDEDVFALLDSLLRNFHIGTVIVWERRDLPAVDGQLAGVPISFAAGRGHLVIDGQQRLGALARALLADHFSCDLLEGRFVADTTPKPWRVPLVLGSGFLALVDWCRAHPEEKPLALELFSRLTRARVPICRIDPEWSVEQVVEMFRRLNSTGVRMAPEDLETILKAYEAGVRQDTP